MTAAPTADGQQLPVAGAADVRQAALAIVRHDARPFTWTLVLTALATLAGLAGPWLLGRIIDEVSDGSGADSIDRLALLIVLSAVAQLLLIRYARYLGAQFGERASAQIRELFLQRVLALPASVVEATPTGDIVARAAGDVTTVAATLRAAAPDVLIALLQTSFILLAVLVVDPLLGLYAIVGLAGIWFASRWYLRRARDAYLAAGEANSALAEMLTASASGAKTIETFGLQDRRLKASAEAIERSRHTRLLTLRLRTVLFPVVDVSYVLPLSGVLLIGGLLYVQGQVSLGDVVACTLYLRQLSGPLEVLELWIDQLQSASASFARLEGIRDAHQDEVRPTRPPADDQIVVSGVRFGYQPGIDVLHDLTLTIQPGEHLAIVGPSGAGKSTLARLLAGIDRPRTGSVTVGGVPVADLAPEQLRGQVLLVTQDHHVFSDSLRNNLLIARPEATDSALRAALEAVGASWVSDLPDGLDTAVGDGGHALDAARAQQLALARVVLADPHTLVLDEATAMLDPSTARTTERTLAAVLKGRTVLAIAHRLHTAHDADRIAVIADGVLVEQGSHEELLLRRGTYARLWSSWHGADVP
jgi:ATP-binding cassette subfamily C protein